MKNETEGKAIKTLRENGKEKIEEVITDAGILGDSVVAILSFFPLFFTLDFYLLLK